MIYKYRILSIPTEPNSKVQTFGFGEIEADYEYDAKQEAIKHQRQLSDDGIIPRDIPIRIAFE